MTFIETVGLDWQHLQTKVLTPPLTSLELLTSAEIHKYGVRLDAYIIFMY